MEPPRIRFTLRQIMALVAIVAISLGLGMWAGKMLRLLELYQRRAAEYGGLKYQRIGMATMLYGERDRRHERWRMGLLAKYEQAARRPWLPVEPDPPEPE